MRGPRAPGLTTRCLLQTHDPYNAKIGGGSGNPLIEEPLSMHGTTVRGRAIALAPSEQTYGQVR